MQEYDRAKVIEALVEGEFKTSVAASRLGLTTRQVLRLKSRFEHAGHEGLMSAKRGNPSNRQLKPDLAKRALEIVHAQYADFGPTLACEKLRERHKIVLSKETLRRLMIEAGLWAPRGERKAVLHQPRDRRACLGELVQIDGSRHAWFEQRRKACALLVYVDDATGRLLELHFAETESTVSYFEATRRYIERHGKPRALYSDKAAVFRSAAANRRAPTQFQRALDELNISLICANSPQAKGRVERMNRSLQDRLVKELRSENIDSIDAANAWCRHFIDDYNKRFARAAQNSFDVHVPASEKDDLERILALREMRKLSATLTLQYHDHQLVLNDSPAARALIGKSVAIHTFADGAIRLRADGVLFPFSRLRIAGRAPRPVETTTKTVHSQVDRLEEKKRTRNRSYRKNPSRADVDNGVLVAKKMAAAKKPQPSLR